MTSTHWAFSNKIYKVATNKNFTKVSSSIKSTKICVNCQLGKNCKFSFDLRKKTFRNFLNKIHYDSWGPIPNNLIQGFKYYVTYIDDHTSYTWFYSPRRKSNFFECFSKFQNLGENQLERQIKIFQNDGQGEFQLIKFQNHLSKCGILQ